MPLVESRLEILAVARHREAEDEVDEGDEQIDLDGEAAPGGSTSAGLAVFSKSKMPMISTSDVSLKKPMKVLTSGGITSRSACGRMISVRLLAVAEAQRVGRLVLALGHRLQAAADDLGEIGARRTG